MGLAQAVKATTTGASSVTTVAADFSTANFLAAFVTAPLSHTLSLADSQSNSWTALTVQSINSAVKLAVFYKATPSVSATQTFTGSLDTSDIIMVAAIGLSGRATTSPVEVSNYAVDPTLTLSHVGGATGGQTAGDDVIFLYSDDEAVSHGRSNPYTVGSGWTLSVNNGDGRFTMTGAIEYQLNVGAGSITGTLSTGSTNTGGGYVLAVKAAAAGTVITPPVGSDTITGNQPTVTAATNTVIQTFVARRSGILAPDRRIIAPRERRIFLPAGLKAA